jgi:uncharacterized protein YjlB
MREDVKKLVETVTGIARPNKRAIQITTRKPHAFKFKDDGETPNSHLPLIIYRSVVKLDPSYDPAAIFEVLFGSNKWADGWRATMYGYNHFHTRTHEVLGIARGRLTAKFGGGKGQEIVLKASDVVIIPSGVGHKHIRQSKDLLIVGAYPANAGKYDEPKPNDVAHEIALAHIAKVPLPSTDPVYGKEGPLFSIWKQKA